MLSARHRFSISKHCRRSASRFPPRHRQFGVLVTTSAIAKQAYTEIREDGHPVLFICGKDITDILIENGHADESVSDFLAREFPIGEKIDVKVRQGAI